MSRFELSDTISTPHPTPPTDLLSAVVVPVQLSVRVLSNRRVLSPPPPPPPLDGPGFAKTRLSSRVLSRTVQSYQKFDAEPHPAPCSPRLSQPIPRPGQVLVERVSDSSGSLQNPGSQAIDLRAFGPALGHLLSAYRRACARASQRRSGTFAETNRCAPQAKKWTVCLAVSACLGHAGVNFQRGHTLFLLEASSWTHSHDKSRWIGPETTCTHFKYFETSHHKSPSSSVRRGRHFLI